MNFLCSDYFARNCFNCFWLSRGIISYSTLRILYLSFRIVSDSTPTCQTSSSAWDHLSELTQTEKNLSTRFIIEMNFTFLEFILQMKIMKKISAIDSVFFSYFCLKRYKYVFWDWRRFINYVIIKRFIKNVCAFIGKRNFGDLTFECMGRRNNTLYDIVSFVNDVNDWLRILYLLI